MKSKLITRPSGEMATASPRAAPKHARADRLAIHGNARRAARGSTRTVSACKRGLAMKKEEK